MAGTEDTPPPGALSFGFLAGAPAGSPLSYNALLTRRKIAEALLGKRSPFPQNIGQGLTYVGEKISDIALMNQLDRAEQQQAAKETAIRSGFPGYEATGQTATTPTTAATTISPPTRRPTTLP
jgi:hypothetical protein